MPDQACPQLDWGSGMTSGKKMYFQITTQPLMVEAYLPLACVGLK
jgi:hypothetical protein